MRDVLARAGNVVALVELNLPAIASLQSFDVSSNERGSEAPAKYSESGLGHWIRG